MRRIIYISLGLISLGFGAIAAAIPLLPAFPFLLLAAFSFARGSNRLHAWFIKTKLYKDNIAPFMRGDGMTWAGKAKTIAAVTISMTIGFIMMGKIPIGRLILSIIWVLHIFYFVFGVKTINPARKAASSNSEEDKG